MADITTTTAVDTTDDWLDFVPLNVGDQYDIDEYWAEEQYCQFEGYMEELKQMIWEEKTYGALWESADELAEIEYYMELEEEQKFLDNNPVIKLRRYFDEMMEMGMYPDKHDCWEGIDLETREAIDQMLDEDLPKDIYDLKDSWT